jgi:hypothetical protein
LFNAHLEAHNRSTARSARNVIVFLGDAGGLPALNVVIKVPKAARAMINHVAIRSEGGIRRPPAPGLCSCSSRD